MEWILHVIARRWETVLNSLPHGIKSWNFNASFQMKLNGWEGTKLHGEYPDFLAYKSLRYLHHDHGDTMN